MTIDEVQQRLLRRGARRRGCSDKEIQQLELSTGLRLPGTYLSFLRLMGRGARPLFEGEDGAYDHLERLQAEAAETAAESDWELVLVLA